MTTEEQQLVERLRAQMAPLKLAADIARPSADGYTYLNDSARALLLQLDQSVHEVAIAYTASEAKVAELQEALKPFAKAADVKLCGEWRDDERFGHTDITFHLTFGDLRAARRALEQSK